MSFPAVTVLGAGNTGFAVAANFALRGVEVTLVEHPDFAAALTPIRESRSIRLHGVAGEGLGQVAQVTTEATAVAENELLLLIVPAYAHRPFAEFMGPHLRSGQSLVLMPGTLGTLELVECLRAQGRDPLAEGIVIAETDTAPYVCRKTAPDAATVWGVVSGLGLAAYPAAATDGLAAQLGPLFTRDGFTGSAPGVTCYPHVLACGLSAMNPVVHPPGVLMNAGRVERSRGEFYFYDEGVTPAVCAVIEALDAERLALGRALGLELTPVAEAFHAAGFGPKGDLWATINGSRMLTALRAPGAINTRWLTEDVPYGLAAWAELGDALGVETPVMDALVRLGLVVTDLVGKDAGRGLRELGLKGLSRDEMLEAATGAAH